MSIVGTVLCHIALDNISKYLKDGLLKDRFNFENESFEQMSENVHNKYSVNIPMRYYYKGKFRKGWVNVINPFRGTWVVGTPGSGKTFSIIEPFIRQHSAKGFAMVVYDYKFPTLAQKLYYHYRINKKAGLTPKGCAFNIINFVNVEYSRRVNPIQLKYISNLAAASETAETLLESLQKGKKEGGGGSDQFFQTSAVNFLAACIYFFCNYEKRPYDENGHEMNYDKTIDRDRTSINLNENMDSLVPGSKIADMPTGWICGQTARDFVKTKTGRGGSMDIQEAEEFQTSKFFCKTDFNMEEISKEEKDYANYPLPKYYNFSSVEARERILYANFLKVNKEVKDMIAEIQEFNKK